jgi:hypothetical protein
MDLTQLIVSKQILINSYKNKHFKFTGNIFDNDLKIEYYGAYPREIIVKYYNNDDIEITDKNVKTKLYNRLKVKLNELDIKDIYNHLNYITLFQKKYKVRFLMEDSYGEFIDPIILDKYEIYKLILYEKQDYHV